MMRVIYMMTILLLHMQSCVAQGQIERDLYYGAADGNEYEQKMCRLDLYIPVGIDHPDLLVWIHGGGLKGGQKHFPERLMDQGFAIAAIDYRLHPQVKHPVYIEDAARALAWLLEQREEYGLSERLVVAGHSAGAYLATMIAYDTSYLAAHGRAASEIDAILPLSGHCITHFTVRAEREQSYHQAVVDEYAPLYHLSLGCPRTILVTGDRELDMAGRYEENALMYRLLKDLGHGDIELHELAGQDHNMVQASMPIILAEMKRVSVKND